MPAGDPRDPPGAARDRTMAVAELAELETLVHRYAPHHTHCEGTRLMTKPAEDRHCNCWRGRALRIIRYGVQN